MNNKNLPFLSIVILTKNSERNIAKCIRGIELQDYPKRMYEIIVIDGNSVDKTLDILKSSKLPIKIYQSDYPNDPESGRGEGLAKSKGEIIGFIDSDNYLPHSGWIRKVINPFLFHEDLVGSYAWRFGYLKADNYLNRYFALIGSADPVGLYLGKADKLSYISDKWIGFGKVLKTFKDYFIVEFDKDLFPTLGSNGFFARKKLLLKAKSDPKNYFHIDVPLDLARLGHSKYSIVKDSIIHDTATTLGNFLNKRLRYMRLHYQTRIKDRRYKVFDPERNADLFKLFMFIFFSITFVQPLYISFKGYLKIRDWAWFVHPIFCFFIMSIYAYAVLERVIIKNFQEND